MRSTSVVVFIPEEPGGAERLSNVCDLGAGSSLVTVMFDLWVRGQGSGCDSLPPHEGSRPLC